jgi:hypothetical protein
LASDFAFRKQALRTLTNAIGVYVVCDLDGIPLYVGQSKDGIRSRVFRHLTSARSDIIGNRQIDVWEIAEVWAYPVATKEEIGPLEALLYHHFNDKNQLINGSVPPRPVGNPPVPEPSQKVEVMRPAERAERRDPSQRLPRQAGHYAQIVGHFLEVKQSKQIGRAIAAHFQRLSRYHSKLLGIASSAEDDSSED